MLGQWALMQAQTGVNFINNALRVLMAPTAFSETLKTETPEDFARHMNFLFSALGISLLLEVVVLQYLQADAIYSDVFRTATNYLGFFLAGFLCYYLLRLWGTLAFGLTGFLSCYAYALGATSLIYGVLKSSASIAMLSNPVEIMNSPVHEVLKQYPGLFTTICGKIKTLECQLALQPGIISTGYMFAAFGLLFVEASILAKLLGRQFQIPQKRTFWLMVVSTFVLAFAFMPIIM